MAKSLFEILVDFFVYYGDDEDTAAAMTRKLLADLSAADLEIVRKNMPPRYAADER